jgi:hypothetical protein
MKFTILVKVKDYLLYYSKYKIAKLTITVQKAITKSIVGQDGPPTNAKVGSGAAEE